MNISSSAVKKTAITAMKENYIPLVVSSVILITAYFLAVLTASVLSSVTNALIASVLLLLLLCFLFAPLVLGLVRMCWHIANGNAASPEEIFFYFTAGHNYIRAITLALHIFVRGFLINTVFSIPAYTALLLSNREFYKAFGSTMPPWGSSLTVVSTVLSILAFIGTVLVMLRYFAAPFFAVCDENMKEKTAISQSLVVSSKTYSEVFGFALTLIGWILLCLLVIPAIFVLPYIAMCYTVYCRFSTYRHNKTVDNMILKAGVTE